MGCFSPDAPKPVNYGEVTRDTLQAQVDLAPQLFASESMYQPLYTQQALQNLNTLLNGSAGGTQTVNYATPVTRSGWYDASGQMVGTDRNQYTTRTGRDGMTTSVPQGVRWVSRGGTLSGTRDITTQAAPGLFALMQQQQTNQRQGDINDVMSLGLQAHDAMLAANPEQAALLAKLNAQANTGLDAGSGLTPEEQRAMQQASRAAFASRGLSGGNAAIGDELLQQFNLGQQLLRQRQQFAQSVLANNQAVVGDPWQQILGRSSGAVNAAQGVGQDSGPALFNPEAGMGLAASNYAAQSQFAAASNPLAQISGILGGAGNFATGLSKLF